MSKMKQLTGPQIFRLACIVVIWLILCYLVVRAQPLTPKIIFFLVASFIIVFVPLYKKYIKNGKR